MDYFFELGLEAWAKLALQVSIILASVAAGWILKLKGWKPGLVGMCISGLSFGLLAFGIVAFNLEWLEFSPGFTNATLFAMFETAVAGFAISMFGIEDERLFSIVGTGTGFVMLAVPCVIYFWLSAIP